MIDIVDLRALVHQSDQVLNDGDDVFLGEYQGLVIRTGVELAVDLVAAHLTEVVPLIAEEQLIDDTAGGLFVRRVTAAQLAVDVLYGLDLTTGRILL